MRLRFILIPVAVALTLTGCGASSAGTGKERIVASFYPLAYAAEQIGGASVDVENLTPPGAEPHDLEVSPTDVADIREADLVLLLGRGFQPQLEDAAGTGDNVLRLLDTPGLGLHANGDPHVWLDPIRYAKIVTRIGQALHRPAAAARLVTRLHELDVDYRAGLAHCDRHDIVTSHEAFAYLAERYGLTQIPITGLTPEAEPRPQDLAHVVQMVKESGATTIFFETLVSPRIAETVAHETGAKTAVLDPIEGLPSEAQARGEDYFSVMRANLSALEKGLGCQ
jgi:zinc transport system substrate-binding protein